MNIVSQDKETIVNYENIEAIGIGCPLENNEGKFLILVNTSSDNQYTIAKYNTEERAKEVLQKIKQTKSDFEYYKNAKRIGDNYGRKNRSWRICENC